MQIDVEVRGEWTGMGWRFRTSGGSQWVGEEESLQVKAA